MQKLAYLILCCFLGFMTWGQKVVTQGEYFWDTDPGQGNGIALSATDGNFDEALEDLFQNGIDVSLLSVGAHTFSVRVKGQNGTWSNTFKQTIYINGPLSIITRTINVTQGEYFWDTDPGFGNGVPLLALDGNFDEVLEELFQNGIDISLLSVGAHNFSVRIKGQDSGWSNTFKQTIYLQGPLTTITRTVNVVEGEYFWDTDPGQGNGTQLLALDGNFDEALEELFQNGISVGAMALGAHNFSTRIKGQNGSWSNTFKQTIFLEGPLTTITRTVNVVQGEYFWDTDPGQGNGTPLLALDGNFDEVLEELFQNGISVGALALGAHNFSTRIKGQDGSWSNTFKQTIFLEGLLTTITRTIRVVQGEYFWDTDPGQGNGTPLLALDGNFDEALEDLFKNSIDVTSMSLGAHNFSARIKGQNGTWSNTFKQTIYLEGPLVTITRQLKVTQGEYFWDTDPGQGNGTPLFAFDATFDEVLEELFRNGIDVSAMSIGAHNFSVRVKGQNGTWSNTFKQTIYLQGPLVLVNRNFRVIQGEYFWDTDPGQGNGTPLLATDGNFNAVLEQLSQTNIDVSSLSLGAHSFSSRVRGFDGVWSPVFKQTIFIECNTPTAPTISIAVTGNGACQGTAVQFTATAVNGGPTPVYLWKVNGSPVGTNSPFYTSSSLNNGDVVTCELTSNSGCASPTSATSNSIVISLTPTVTPTLSVGVSPSNSICFGTSVTFTATTSNGGGSPVYQWMVNGINVGTNSPTFTSTTLLNSDVVTCTFTSSTVCAIPSSITSSGITMSVTPVATPSISIFTSTPSTCTGNTVTFTASASNGGVSPVYQWKVNGVNVGTNSTIYSTSSLNNGDVVTCQLTSSLGCVTSSTVTSNSITITSNPVIATSVSITSSEGTTICAGTTVTYTATASNGGIPSYQWYVNGSPVGSNSSTYSTAVLSTGSTVMCEMTSTLTCATPALASSNIITMTVNSPASPSVSISSTSPIICSGGTVSFTATPTNGGTPTYQWYINGSPVGTNSASFSYSSFNNGDVVTCSMTSSLSCVTTSTVNSNAITITITTPVTPAVSISASATTICGSTPVTFTATPTNGGPSPDYQWFVNGVPVGTNSPTYSSSGISNGDVVMCTLTSSIACVTTSTVNSNSINMTVNPTIATSVSIASSTSTTICAGTSVTFTATPVNGGTPTYQWFVNGSPVGSNSATYTTSSLTNGSVVTCQMTSSLSCPNPTVASSNTITMTVNSITTPTVTISSNQGSSICGGTNVTFTAAPTNGGSSPSYQWFVNGSPVGSNSATYSSTILTNGAVVTCTMTSNAVCVSGATANSNSITMSVTTPVTPTVSIAASATTICSGTSVTFSATSTNGGGSPVYQWYVNATPVGTNSTSYTSSSLSNGDVVSCVMTSSIGCVTSSTANSNTITMTVNPSVATAVSISSSAGTTICSGTSVTFTATPVNGGTPSYQWFVNGSPVGSNSATYTTSALSNGSIVTCQMTSSLSCPIPAIANSNAITMTVNSNATPTVTISSNQGSSICGGTNVTFTATPTNGGGSPAYQWYLNGSPVGTNSATYSNAGLSNGDAVSCVLTSNAICVTSSTATSNTITMSVTTPVTPAVSITASTTTICPGTSVTFTATPTNGGGSPVYQWYVNGGPVGSNSSTYTTSGLNNGDVVMCTLTSSIGCATASTATSNSINMTVNPSVATSVSISSSTSTTICAGTSVTFTATPVNGGTPTYQWFVNGSPVGSNSATYTSSSLTNGSVVTCQMSSSLSCPSPAVASSNAITMTVNSIVTPAVTISSNQGSSICSGTNVTFTANPTNGGGSPAYQWYLNGSPVGTNSATYNNATLTNGDVVSCELTSSATCVSSSTANSNTITITVVTPVTPTVSITASATTICAGTSVTFTATPTNGGGSPVYQWYVNGAPAGTNSATYTTSSLANGNVVTCVLTSSIGCVTSATANSNSVTMTVNPTVSTFVTIGAPGTTICQGTAVTFTANATNGGGFPTYQWFVNGTPVGTNNPNYTTSSLNNGDVVTCQMTSSISCASPATASSNSIIMTVNSVVTPTVSISSNQGSSICGGTNVTFTATPTNGGGSPAYQWYLNGSPVGTNSATYSNAALSNGDVVSCVLTSSATCVSSSTANSNAITITVVSPVTPAVSITASATTICAGTSVTFTATPTNGGGSPVYQWYVNGVPAGTNSATYTTSSLANGNVVTCMLTSSIGCVTSATANSNSVTMTVNPTVSTFVTIGAPGTTICQGTAVTFTANATNGGGFPTYQWFVNGTPVGTNNPNYTTSSLNNGDVVTCDMTSSLSCPSPATATSNTIVMTVNSTAAPTVSIASNQGSSICGGTNVTFTATPTNGGAAPVYQWFLNGTPVGSNSATYSNAALANGDVVACELTSNAPCASSSTANSNTITMTVTAPVTPAVSITASATTICSGTAVTFTATPTNGGAADYQWFVNGSPVGTNSATYTSSSLSNGNTVTCQMTSSLTCATPTAVTSNSITMTVNSSANPTISISRNPAGAICSGTNVTFTASITNGGAAPTYQWFVNGAPVGSNSATYSSSTLANGDVVTCTLTSNAPCISVSSVTSNSLTMTVNQSVTPTITITSNPTMPVCETQSVTFTATITNGGSNPSYQWKKNGQNYGLNSPTYTTSLWSDGDVFTCVLTSNAPCATQTQVTSNAITADVVNIDATTSVAGNVITANQSGATYQWIDCTTQFAIPGATQQSYTVTETGLYAVQVTVGSCMEESGCEWVDANALIDLSAAGIKLYPNPANDYFVIELPENSELGLVMYDIAGRIVHEQKLSGTLQQIDVRLIANGNYRIVLSDGNREYIGKLVINR